MQLRLVMLLAVAFLFSACSGTATEEPTASGTKSGEKSPGTGGETVAVKEPAGPSPGEQLATLEKEFQTKSNDFNRRARRAPPDERAALLDEFTSMLQPYTDKFLNLAEANPEDPASIKALSWIVRNSRDFGSVDQAISVLVENHADDESMTDVVWEIRGNRQPSAADIKLLEKLSAATKLDAVKGASMLVMANKLTELSELSSVLQDKDLAEQVNQAFGEENVAAMKELIARTSDQDIEQMLVSLVKDYGDIETPRGTLIAKEAEEPLYVLQNLSVGKVAPDIEGEDIDGESFKLSDYRGKVVMLDFWGDW